MFEYHNLTEALNRLEVAIASNQSESIRHKRILEEDEKELIEVYKKLREIYEKYWIYSPKNEIKES